MSRALVLAAILLGVLGPCRGAPEDGGQLVVGTPSDLTSCNPYLVTDVPSDVMAGVMYNALLRYDDRLEIVGDLAESWEVSADGTAYTFRLRKGVKFHDGVELTADDVGFTLDYLRNPALRTVRRGYIQAIADHPTAKDRVAFEKLGTHEFRVRYRHPYCPGLSDWASMAILPRHRLAAVDPNENDFRAGAGARPIGTGPFKLARHAAGEHVTFAANLDYFKGRPHLDRLVFRVVPRAETLMQLAETRQIDYTDVDLTQLFQVYKGNERFLDDHRFFTWDSFRYAYIMWNNDPTRSPYFADRRVRQAMNHAIDVPNLIRRVTMGKARRSTGPFHPRTWAHDPDLKPYAHDPERARRLLAEAGWKDTDGDGWLDKGGRPFRFTLRYSAGNPATVARLSLVQTDLRKVGVDAQLEGTEWATLDGTLLAGRTFDAATLLWFSGLDPDPYEMWHSSAIPKSVEQAGFNRVGYANPEVDALIEEARRTCDRATRQRCYRRIHRILHEDAPFTFVFIPPQYVALDKRVRWHRDEVESTGVDADLKRPMTTLSPRGLLTEDFLTRSWIPKAERRAGE